MSVTKQILSNYASPVYQLAEARSNGKLINRTATRNGLDVTLTYQFSDGSIIVFKDIFSRIKVVTYD